VILTSRSLAFLGLGASSLLILLYLLFPVEGVRVEGNQMLPESAILDDIPERISLPLINAPEIERKLNSNPWVEGVSVDKTWESGRVVVEVEEREAALNASLSGGGRVVLAGDGTRLPGLGEAALEEVEVDRVRLGEIQEVQEALEENGVGVSSVESVGPGGVEVSVRGPGSTRAQVLFSGEVGGGQARVLRGLLRERPDVRYFDLRTPGRVVVGQAPPRNGASAGDSA